MRLKPKVGDYLVFLLIVVAVVVLSAFLHERDTDSKTAVIIQNGVVIREISLDKIDKKVTIEYHGEYPGLIEAEKGRIRFKEALCPDKVCVNTGWVSRTGQIAVCLPGKIMIKIVGGDDGGDTDILLR